MEESVHYFVSINPLQIICDNKILATLSNDIGLSQYIPPSSKSFIQDNSNSSKVDDIIKNNPKIYWIRYREMTELQ